MNNNDIIINLIFSLNATMPLFIMMVLGFWLKKINFLDEHSTKKINQLVFKIFLPALLFIDLAKAVYVDEKGVCPFGVFKTNNETYVHYTGETTDLNFESIERMVNKYISKNVEPIDLLEMFNSLKSEPDYPYLILEV